MSALPPPTHDSTRRKALFVFAGMLASIAAGQAMRPTRQVYEMGTDFSLEHAFPRAFGDWAIDPSVVPLLPSPELQKVVAAAYDQTLARTYRNAAGYRVMLSVSYGGRRDQSMDIHRPEICYPAQGMSVRKSTWDTQLDVGGGERLPLRRLVAGNGPRNEPISYWLVIGRHVAGSGFEHRLATFVYGLTGRIPDGMLVRVSTVDDDEAQSFAAQDSFLRALLGAMQPQDRHRLLGTLNG